MRGLLLPGTPLLLPGVDLREPPAVGVLRALVRERIVGRTVRLLADPEAALPRMLGLGGIGLDIGVRVGPDGHLGPVLRGEDYLAALPASEPPSADPEPGLAFVVAAVLASLSGAHARIVPATGLETDALVLLPTDFSAAAHPDGPLAPRATARGFDAQLVDALARPRTDLAAAEGRVLRATIAQGTQNAADTAALERFLDLAPSGVLHTRALGSTDVHHVHYLVAELELVGRIAETDDATTPSDGADEVAPAAAASGTARTPVRTSPTEDRAR